ncbi:UDP-glycosyltransferase 83A1-like [Pistacia vera]|uniref:UDP-glycosyltransferase 83A1-like n=1 Tax=Pistacia vera TaxID=55513 RepID=UPI001263B247|nr:UDP-glycosyltransferase 83A1-like [Pistacia vera]
MIYKKPMLVQNQAGKREKTEMTRPHILVIPLPAQGHVISLLELSHYLVKHGLRVTFVNTDHTHKRVINALQEKNYVGDDEEIRLVSIPDGLEPWEDRNDLGKLCESLVMVMPGKLEELIQEINNKEEDEKITCVIADMHVGMTLKTAKKLKIKGAAFMPMAVASLALYYHIPKLIDDGIINKDGKTLNKHFFFLVFSLHDKTRFVTFDEIDFPLTYFRNYDWETYDSAGAKHSYNQQCKSYLERWRLNHPEEDFPTY